MFQPTTLSGSSHPDGSACPGARGPPGAPSWSPQRAGPPPHWQPPACGAPRCRPATGWWPIYGNKRKTSTEKLIAKKNIEIHCFTYWWWLVCVGPHREHEVDEKCHFWNVEEDENQNQDSGFFQKLGSGKHKIIITNHKKLKRRLVTTQQL